MINKPDGDNHPIDQILSTDIEHMMPSRYHTTGDIKDSNTFLASDVAEFMTKWLHQIITMKEIRVRVVGIAETRVMEEVLERSSAVISEGYVTLKDSANEATLMKLFDSDAVQIGQLPEENQMEIALVQAYRQGLIEAKQLTWDVYKLNGHSSTIRRIHDAIMALVYKSERNMQRLEVEKIDPLSSPVRHWTHVMSGTSYREIARGKMQHKDKAVDMINVVVYVGIDGQTWVRPTKDFQDGRFKIAYPSKSWYRRMFEKLSGDKPSYAGSRTDV